MAEPQYVYLKERQLRCFFCDHDRFKTVKTKIYQRVLSILDLEFLSKSATSYICASCGMVHEFANR